MNTDIEAAVESLRLAYLAARAADQSFHAAEEVARKAQTDSMQAWQVAHSAKEALMRAIERSVEPAAQPAYVYDNAIDGFCQPYKAIAVVETKA